MPTAAMHLHPVLFGVHRRSVVFMFGDIVLFDIARVIVIPLQRWRQDAVGQTVAVCWQNPQGHAWKQTLFLDLF